MEHFNATFFISFFTGSCPNLPCLYHCLEVLRVEYTHRLQNTLTKCIHCTTEKNYSTEQISWNGHRLQFWATIRNLRKNICLYFDSVHWKKAFDKFLRKGFFPLHFVHRKPQDPAKANSMAQQPVRVPRQEEQPSFLPANRSNGFWKDNFLSQVSLIKACFSLTLHSSEEATSTACSRVCVSSSFSPSTQNGFDQKNDTMDCSVT